MLLTELRENWADRIYTISKDTTWYYSHSNYKNLFIYINRIYIAKPYSNHCDDWKINRKDVFCLPICIFQTLIFYPIFIFGRTDSIPISIYIAIFCFSNWMIQTTPHMRHKENETSNFKHFICSWILILYSKMLIDHLCLLFHLINEWFVKIFWK